MAKIGFIGLGHMGAPMAQNLLKAGHELIVFDIADDAMRVFADQGVKTAGAISEAAADVDAVITMLPSGKHVQEICTGEQGLFKIATPGTLFIDSSSIDVTSARSVAKQAKQAGMRMVDAPVSGGVAGAGAGTLTFMVGGEIADFESAKTILENMGKAIIHTGLNGNGQAAKICNNMILGISMIAVSEGFILAKKLGLDVEKLFEVSSQASGQCWSMTSYCPVPGLVPSAPSNNDYEPGFTTQMMLKDLRLSQNAAESVGAATPLGAESTALYTLFNNLGNGQKDFSGIIKLIEGQDV